MILTTTISAEDDGFVAVCPELDIASQGDSPAEASANLREALALFIETADPSEIDWRFRAHSI
jgi:predicted RNase H-like HicB family nuclease